MNIKGEVSIVMEERKEKAEGRENKIPLKLFPSKVHNYFSCEKIFPKKQEDKTFKSDTRNN